MKEHVISDQLLERAQLAFLKNEHWIAYNTITYFLEEGEVFFFKTSDEAHEFAGNNISEYDDYRVIYARSMDELLRQIPYGEKLKELLTLKNKSMNENNLAYLEKQLLNLGFGEEMNAAMKKNIEDKVPEFNLQHTFRYGGKGMDVELSFRAGNENEMYFFNKYQATLTDDPGKSQTFYLDRGNAITTKEAFNLLDGRAVNKDLRNKEGEKYNAWVQLDFGAEKDKYGNHPVNRYHENYGYDLKASMNELIMKPMSPEDEDKLYNSLMKGNVQSVTFLRDGEEVKGFIEANPKERTINMYDGHMKPLSNEEKQNFLDMSPAKLNGQRHEHNGEAVKQKDQKEQRSAMKKGGDDLEDSAQLKKKRNRKKGKGLSV